MNLEVLKKTLKEHKKFGNVFKRNIVKEYFQILALSFIYSRKPYQNLVFYGGSCLRHCFNLPRLSEDLDFVDLGRKISLEKLAGEIGEFFKEKFDFEPVAEIQKFRIYLKFPILFRLGLAKSPESNFLILKIEIFNKFDCYKKYNIEIIPIFKFNQPILVRTFDLPTLMATKLGAVLYRRWEKTDKSGKILAQVKGRDYFDLACYLRTGVRPNLKCIKGVKSKEDLESKLLEAIGKIDSKSIKFDLEALIPDKNFVQNFSKSIKEILRRNISSLSRK